MGRSRIRRLSYTWLYKFDNWETSGTIYVALPLLVHYRLRDRGATAYSISFVFLTIPSSPFRFNLLDGKVAIKYMRGLVLLTAKNRFKQIYPLNGSRGILATSTPKKQENNESGEMGLATNKEMIDPIVTFSRPPPLPPVLGPLVALSLLEAWWNRPTDDDGK
ncbi:hypothetical protein SESBI_17653 [Sesbania bispinosa]|nr:hypothetical protein SESBI_17653 [Sesbania bispinosa]